MQSQSTNYSQVSLINDLMGPKTKIRALKRPLNTVISVSDPHVFGTIGKVLKRPFQWYQWYFSIIYIGKVMLFQRFRNFS